MTRQEIEQKMDELAREYYDTHDPEIPEEIPIGAFVSRVPRGVAQRGGQSVMSLIFT
jgi:hypothetical protein